MNYQQTLSYDETDTGNGYAEEINSAVCGDYCKNLRPEQQRQIIQQIIKNDSEDGSLINRANSGRIGDKKYLVSSQWWSQWCDYVNFDH